MGLMLAKQYVETLGKEPLSRLTTGIRATHTLQPEYGYTNFTAGPGIYNAPFHAACSCPVLSLYCMIIGRFVPTSLL